MLNYKVVRNTDKFFDRVKGSYTYKYKGKDYEITQESLQSMDPRLQQSFAHFTSQFNKKEQSVISQVNKTIKRGGTYLPDTYKVEVTNKMLAVRKELIRLAKTEILVEEKLDMPKVFKALITQPHTERKQ